MSGAKEIVLAIITVIGGLAFFLYGMNVMSSGLEKMAGGKLEQALKKLTSNMWLSLFLGTFITIVLQSSSSLTVMLVGLVNCGVMEVSQTVVIIIGANIGKTFTTWLLCLMGVDTEGPLWLSLLNPEYFSLVFAMVGAVLIMMSKNGRKKDIGAILVGFAVLMYGMVLMGDAVAPLKESEEFQQMLTKFENPFLGVLAGTVVTGVIQSSAASIGILQRLADATGNITFGMAIPIIMGQNIGTCVTAVISSFGVTRNAKKVGVIHIAFNIIGTVIFLTAYEILEMTVGFSFSKLAINSVGIAIVHTVFNLATTVLLLPFAKWLEKIANWVLPDKNEEEEPQEEHALLDKRLLTTPSVAIAECDEASRRMAKLAKETVLLSLSLLTEYDKKVAEKVSKNEDRLDSYEDKIGTTLVQLTSQALSEHDSQVSSRVLRAIGDFERLGDHAINLSVVAKQIHDEKITFSEHGVKEMEVLTEALEDILERAYRVYKTVDEEKATEIEPLEQVIDYLTRDIKANHVRRLQKGSCTIETGFVLSDILTDFERISDHCSNIAVSIVETTHSTFGTHEYLNKVKFGNKNFTDKFEKFSQQDSISKI